jgi:hypothetical protein
LRRTSDPKLAKEFLRSAQKVKGLKAEKCNFELPNSMNQALTSYCSDHKHVDILSFGLHLFLLCVALVIWKFTFFPASLLPSSRARAVMSLSFMLVCVSALYFALVKWSAPSVREDSGEISFYLVFSMIWIALVQASFSFLGISVRDDVAERGNNSAAFVAAGLTIGATCCIAGANVGDGPGFEVVLFCGALATTCLFLLWVLVAQVSGVADVIAIDRDLGTGIRAGGLLAGMGIVLGACVAGDWVSIAVTLKDFARFSWPVTIAVYLFAVTERAVRRRAPAATPSRTVSILVALAMAVALAEWSDLRTKRWPQRMKFWPNRICSLDSPYPPPS